jgi:hypothetical protein
MLASKPGTIRLGHEYWPEQEMLKTPFYEEYLRKFDIRHMAALVTEPRAGFVESLSLYRGHSAERFDQESVAALDFLYPHLQTAFYNRRKLLALEARVSQLEAALDNLDCPLVQLNSSFKAALANRSARKILNAREGLLFRNGRLHAGSPPESASLYQVLSKAVNAGMRRTFASPAWLSISRLAKRALQLTATPLLSEAHQSPGGAVAAVFITDPEPTPRLPCKLLLTLYGLTRMEAQLALQLLSGMSLEEAVKSRLPSGNCRRLTQPEMPAAASKSM